MASLPRERGENAVKTPPAHAGGSPTSKFISWRTSQAGVCLVKGRQKSGKSSEGTVWVAIISTVVSIDTRETRNLSRRCLTTVAGGWMIREMGWSDRTAVRHPTESG